MISEFCIYRWTWPPDPPKERQWLETVFTKPRHKWLQWKLTLSWSLFFFPQTHNFYYVWINLAPLVPSEWSMQFSTLESYAGPKMSLSWQWLTQPQTGLCGIMWSFVWFSSNKCEKAETASARPSSTFPYSGTPCEHCWLQIFKEQKERVLKSAFFFSLSIFPSFSHLVRYLCFYRHEDLPVVY